MENRFTGWVDVPLTFRGQLEAIRAGRFIKNADIIPNVVCSSALKRCIRSTWQVLDRLDRSWLPVEKNWR
ncbi:histidine phosphatase family protein [Pantoea sp. At-9b]|uniref:histidine phosphatase family protein n=1 Tax=Pantoea sp. (strain At-9b) TaxID=592316 RepID=UPI0009FDD1B7